MISWIASTIFGVHYPLRNFRICQTVLRRRLRFVLGYDALVERALKYVRREIEDTVARQCIYIGGGLDVHALARRIQAGTHPSSDAPVATVVSVVDAAHNEGDAVITMELFGVNISGKATFAAVVHRTGIDTSFYAQERDHGTMLIDIENGTNRAIGLQTGGYGKDIRPDRTVPEHTAVCLSSTLPGYFDGENARCSQLAFTAGVVDTLFGRDPEYYKHGLEDINAPSASSLIKQFGTAAKGFLDALIAAQHSGMLVTPPGAQTKSLTTQLGAVYKNRKRS